jgi:hypothetical protein
MHTLADWLWRPELARGADLPKQARPSTAHTLADWLWRPELARGAPLPEQVWAPMGGGGGPA